MSIYLYVKTHQKTGLKYFGKTIKDDPYEYMGSGKYWKSHLKKHGNYVDTEVLGCFAEDEVESVALNFSKDNDIVESKEWANLKEENGLDGGGFLSTETRAKMSASRRGKKHSKETKAKLSIVNKGKKHSTETRAKMSVSRKGKKGHQHSKETKDKIGSAMKNRIWCNNGLKSIMCYEDDKPNGYVKGRLCERGKNICH